MKLSEAWFAQHEADQDDTSQALIRRAGESITDRTVARALAAYESLPSGSGVEARMRVALFAVTGEGREYFESMAAASATAS